MIPFNPFSALTSKIFGGIAIAAISFATIQTVRIEGFWFIDGFKQDLKEKDREIAERDAASAANLAAAQQQVRDMETKFMIQVQENIHVENDLRAAMGARSAANADRMRFDKVCRLTPAAAREDHPAPEPDSPGADAIVVERRDYDTLVENTVRLQAAHEWAVGLIKADSAVPDPAFGR